MLNHEIYDLTQMLQGALFQDAMVAYQSGLSEDEKANQSSPPLILQLRRGYAESPAWVMAQIQEFYPEPLTVEKFRKRAVYSAPGLVHALLELLASEKWLDRRADGYHLTEAGQEHLQSIRSRGRTIFHSYKPRKQPQIERLTEMVSQIIEASLQADNPPGTWSLAHSRRRAPDGDAAVVHQLIHFCSDFNAFRDDCHMAAYRPYDVEGHAWEALGLVAQGEASTADNLFDNLAYRGFAVMDWEAALKDLEAHSWIHREADEAAIIPAGQETREAVESATDHHFFAPWRQVLSEGEIEETVDLMREIHDDTSAQL